MSHLTLNSVTKTFGGVPAVQGLDLSVDDGETVVLLGPSGCGKTTCLRMIAGFERPDSGEIKLAGRTLASPKAFVPPEKRQMAVVFQSYALWPHMTVYDNVAFGPSTAQAGRDEIRQRVAEVLELVHLDGYDGRYPHQLSGGQQQRVALARALVTRPSLLLLDEPLSNLDTRLREEMRGEVKRIQQLLDVAMVYVTHDQAEALSLADRLVVMNAGRLEQVGTPKDVYRRPHNGYVARALGAANIVTADVIGTHGDSSHVRLLGGLDLNVDTSRLNGSLIGRSQVSVSIRPADIRLAPFAGEGPRATVTESMFFGDIVQYSIELPTQAVLTVTGSGASPYRPGDVLSLDVPPDAVATLDDRVHQPTTKGEA